MVIATGSQTYSQTFDGLVFDLYTYRPTGTINGLFMIFHGSSRDASGYRDSAIDLANAKGYVVVCPLFDATRFPSDEYQRANIVDDNGAVNPKSEWTTRFAHLMTDWAKAEIGGSPLVYLYGYSAGGQFLSRVASYDPLSGVERWVVGAPSTYVIPDVLENAPYGFALMGNTHDKNDFNRAYLSLPLSIMVGALDNDPNDPDLGDPTNSLGQGAHRLERAQNTYELGRVTAAAENYPFGWRLVIAAGVGHSNGAILDAPEIDTSLAPWVLPDSYHMNRVISQWRESTDDDELWVTEYGHHTYDPGTDSPANFTPNPDVAANYFLRGITEFHNRNAHKVFLYTFKDDYDTSGDEYGLIRQDNSTYTGTKRPAYHAVQRFLNLFRDTTPVTPTDRVVVLTGNLSNIKVAWHQRSNGKYLLTLFNDEQTWDRVAMSEVAFPDRTIRLGFASRQALSVTRWLPTFSASSSLLASNVDYLDVGVPDEVMVLEIEFSGAQTFSLDRVTLDLTVSDIAAGEPLVFPMDRVDLNTAVNEVSIIMTAPNEDPANVDWIRVPFSSQERFEDPVLSGIAAFPKQWWHGGDRSHIDPWKVMMGMDVNQPARLEKKFTHAPSGNEYLYWMPVKGIGLNSRLTATVRASGTSANTWVLLMANSSAGAAGAGLYRTTNYGDTWTRVQAMNAVRGGVSGWDGQYRQNRRMVTWWPNNPNKWICVNSHYECWLSTNDGVDWVNQGNLPTTMGNVFWVVCHPGTTAQQMNTAYAATSTGLFRTQDSGQTWNEFGTGLPADNKFICGLDINPANANEITVAVLDNGLWRATNGSAFSQLYAHQCTAGFAISPANRQNIWLFGTSTDRNGTVKSGTNFMRYSTNGGTSFTELKVNLSNDANTEAQADCKGQWMGWIMDDYQLRMRDDGNTRNAMRTIVLPHPTVGGDAIAHAGTVFWWTQDVKTFYNQSFGMDSLGWGDASEGNLEWSGTNGNNVKAGIFDDGMYRSSTHMDWWVIDNSGNVGSKPGLTQYANYCCSTNPSNANRWLATVGYYGNSSVAKKIDGAWSWALPDDTLHHNTWCKWATSSVVYTSKYRSTNGASSFAEYPSNGRPFSTNSGNGGVIGCSPANTSVIFAANDAFTEVYRNTNQGAGGSWEGPITLPAHIHDDRDHMSKAFTPHESDATQFYVYSTNLGLRSYKFPGGAVTEYGGEGLLNAPQVVRVDPLNPNIKYVFGRSNGAQTNVIRTVNNGLSWQDISRNLPRTGSLRGMEIDPTNGDVYLGGTCGTYMLPSPADTGASRYWNVRAKSVPIAPVSGGSVIHFLEAPTLNLTVSDLTTNLVVPASGTGITLIPSEADYFINGDLFVDLDTVALTLSVGEMETAVVGATTIELDVVTLNLSPQDLFNGDVFPLDGVSSLITVSDVEFEVGAPADPFLESVSLILSVSDVTMTFDNPWIDRTISVDIVWKRRTSS